MTQLPRMLEMRQSFPPSRRLDIPNVLQEQFAASGVLTKIAPGMKIAVGVGSRGITNLAEIVRAVLAVLTAAGARPFIVPAMGSHGGATAEGQKKVLAEYGVTAESMGVPVEASMEVQKIGTALDSRDVVFSTAALQADGIVAINRVKPHTDFRGNMGSGIQKMLTIGFGKQIGAANAHVAATHLGHERVFREFSRVILQQAPILCGVALVEDQHHQTAEIQVLAKENIPAGEEKLFSKAASLLARLPFDEIDLLIVDQLGKEISGSGMDTNVIGRDISGYSASLHAENGAIKPHIYRIFVRDLTHATNGNGSGIGLADFTTSRVVKALDLKYTYVNAMTSIGLLPAKIPIYFDNDREVLQQAIASLATSTPDKLRVVRIANTLNVDRFQASEACADLVRGRGDVTAAGPAAEMQFDSTGNLLPL